MAKEVRHALTVERPKTRKRIVARLSRKEETRLITHAYDMKGTWGLLIKTLFQTGEDACEEQAMFCRKVRVWGQIQKLVVRNAMTYRLPNSRKSNFATEPSPLAREGVHDRTDDAIRPPYGG